jgi:hypothetical protein
MPDNIKLLYLINKDIYIHKLSRVRFHAINSLSEICNLTIWGPNWNYYDSNLDLNDNITKLNTIFDFIIVYKPEHLKNFDKVSIKKCITYNEMWDEPYTLNEINNSKCELIICHHENDMIKYKTKLFKNINYYTELYHIPHCAKKDIFFDNKSDKPIDILLCGSIGRHYPLRQRLQKLLSKFPKKYNCVEYKHPGYIQTNAYTDIYLKDFAEVINKSKICITCTSKYKYRLGKMVEIPMCNSVLACDLPDQDIDIFKEIMIVLDEKRSDDEIINKLVYYLENPTELETIRNKGYEWSQKYIQEYYANELLQKINIIKTKKLKFFVIGDELTSINEKWICDVFKEEFNAYSNLTITDNIAKADIIWLLAPWSMRKFRKSHFENKYVVTSIHHIDWDKYDENINYYKNIDSITNRYHVICPKPHNDLKKITNKKIVEANFWINENNYFHIQNKSELRKKYDIPLDAFVIGSFQKDTEGKDDMLPKLSKGPDIFIKIIEDMKKTKDNIFVVLTGWRRNYVMKELNKIKVKYIFLELVDLITINELYNCLDLYIVSSRVEGGPRSIIECGLAKVPLISTCVGISELILSPESIYDFNDFLTYKLARPNVDYAYEKALNYTVKNYMKNFINILFDL